MSAKLIVQYETFWNSKRSFRKNWDVCISEKVWIYWFAWSPEVTGVSELDHHVWREIYQSDISRVTRIRWVHCEVYRTWKVIKKLDLTSIDLILAQIPKNSQGMYSKISISMILISIHLLPILENSDNLPVVGRSPDISVIPWANSVTGVAATGVTVMVNVTLTVDWKLGPKALMKYLEE